MIAYIGAVALALAGLLLRGGGTIAETRQSRWADTPGWALRAGSAWLFAAAFGAWAPLWLGATLIAAAVGLALAVPKGRPFRLGVDATMVLAACVSSVPTIAMPRAMTATVIFVTAGFMLDRWLGVTGDARDSAAEATGAEPARAALHRTGVLIRPLLVLLILLTGIAGTAWLAGRTTGSTRAWFANWTHFAIAPIMPGGRVELPTGAVAWLHHPNGPGPHPVALLFHGADPAGARQKAAEVIRRVLLDVGFIVLILDHPGFGASPATDLDAELKAWDPLPHARAALRHARSLPKAGPVIAIGHSMGCSQALRLLHHEGDDLRLAVLFGASGPDPAARDPYWYRRFHRDRGLKDKLPVPKWRRIREAYYNDLAAARALPSDHPPVCFVEFEFEHPNIIGSRDQLYRAIPGMKRRWQVPLANHYFCAQDLTAFNLIVGNTDIASRIGDRVLEWLRRPRP